MRLAAIAVARRIIVRASHHAPQVAELLLSLTHVKLDGEELTMIDNLDCFSSCTHLFVFPALIVSSSHHPRSFLQRNFLIRVENLDHLSSLQFLVLSRNRLTSLLGLSCLPNLLALDVDHNALADIPTEQLPQSLLYLNCAGNPFDDYVSMCMRLFADAELRTIDGADEDAWLEQVDFCISQLRFRSFICT
jgi:Leucine-rich repeat (LRR) protein